MLSRPRPVAVATWKAYDDFPNNGDDAGGGAACRSQRHPCVQERPHRSARQERAVSVPGIGVIAAFIAGQITPAWSDPPVRSWGLGSILPPLSTAGPDAGSGPVLAGPDAADLQVGGSAGLRLGVRPPARPGWSRSQRS